MVLEETNQMALPDCPLLKAAYSLLPWGILMVWHGLPPTPPLPSFLWAGTLLWGWVVGVRWIILLYWVLLLRPLGRQLVKLLRVVISPSLPSGPEV